MRSSVYLPLSSGDPRLDRRFQWARGLIERGEAAAAAELLAETLREAPNFLAGWFARGEACEQTGAGAEAVAAFRRALALDPSDRLGASLRLVRLGEESPGGTPAAYVRELFDQYAPRFDRELVDHLSYRGPALLIAAIEQVAGVLARFPRVLDLGCGTGLMGAAIRARAGELMGVDLSPAMLAEAQGKCLYDRVVTADLLDFLPAEGGAFNLALAADVLLYVRDLAPVVIAVARVLSPGGLFAFTLERCDGDATLGAGLRYAHGEAHVRAAAASAGLAVRRLAAVSTRSEKQSPVPGWAVVLSRG